MGVKHHELWVRWRDERDRSARDQLVEAYLWVVRYVAGRLMIGLPSQFEQGDLEGHGCFGLLEAVERYDPERGVRFETFAIPWVRGASLEGIRALQWAPALRKRVRQVEKASLELERVLGREPTIPEIARVLKLSVEETEKRMAEAGCLSVLSLDDSLHDQEGDATAMAELIADPNTPDPAEESVLAERRERLAKAIESLSEQERHVVSLFYFDGLIAREISEVLGLSPARVSQIHSRAIFRLRGKLARMRAQMVS